MEKLTDAQPSEYLQLIKKAAKHGFNTESLESKIITAPRGIRPVGSNEVIYVFHDASCLNANTLVKISDPSVNKTITFSDLLTCETKSLTCKRCNIFFYSKESTSNKQLSLQEILNLIKILIQALEFSEEIETKILNKTPLTFKESLMYFKLYYKVYLNKEKFLFTFDANLQKSFNEKLKTLETIFENGLSTELFEKTSVALLFEKVQEENALFENYCNLLYSVNKDKQVLVAQELDEYRRKKNTLKFMMPPSAAALFTFNELILMRAHQKYNYSNENVFVIPDNTSHIFTIGSDNTEGFYSHSWNFEMCNVEENISEEVKEILISIYPQDMISANFIYSSFENPSNSTYPNLSSAYEHAKLLTIN